MKDLVLLIVFLVFSLAAAIQTFYYLWFYLAVHLHKPKSLPANGKPVSVIICARNEAANLREFLPSVLEQDYPDYEVIVVNDCSEDDTYKVLGDYILKYPHLKVSTINKDPKFTHSKKLAQFIGIKAAKNDILLFTDADCMPVSQKWISRMTSHYSDETISYVLGYGGYMRRKGLLNLYLRTETVFIAMQYLGMAIRGIPYMGVGRNMSYLRSEFFRNNGFGLHSNLASGDDDLFINANALGSNTSVEFSQESNTLSVPVNSTEEWIKQKRRHLTTAPYYKPAHKLILTTEPASRMLFYILFPLLLSFGYLWIEVLAIFGARLVLQATVISLAQKKLGEKGIVPFSILFDIFSPLVNGILFISNKGRRHLNIQWN